MVTNIGVVLLLTEPSLAIDPKNSLPITDDFITTMGGYFQSVGQSDASNLHFVETAVGVQEVGTNIQITITTTYQKYTIASLAFCTEQVGSADTYTIPIFDINNVQTVGPGSGPGALHPYFAEITSTDGQLMEHLHTNVSDTCDNGQVSQPYRPEARNSGSVILIPFNTADKAKEAVGLIAANWRHTTSAGYAYTLGDLENYLTLYEGTRTQVTDPNYVDDYSYTDGTQTASDDGVIFTQVSTVVSKRLNVFNGAACQIIPTAQFTTKLPLNDLLGNASINMINNNGVAITLKDGRLVQLLSSSVSNSEPVTCAEGPHAQPELYAGQPSSWVINSPISGVFPSGDMAKRFYDIASQVWGSSKMQLSTKPGREKKPSVARHTK
jgi:hypothetical protein